eukprot:GDKI01025889.1.p1 GENE.GDKI01025889.1~~GDKI01025889.1.p1  ORF type:complete len:413 (-),score=68.89 GDKI01025889.1:43-1281(-)
MSLRSGKKETQQVSGAESSAKDTITAENSTTAVVGEGLPAVQTNGAVNPSVTVRNEGWDIPNLCETFKIPLSASKLTREERRDLVFKTCVKVKPNEIEKGSLNTVYPMSFWEQFQVLFIFVVMGIAFVGTPALWYYLLFTQQWRWFFIWSIAIYIQIVHKVPRVPWLSGSHGMLLLFRYFSFRWIWTDTLKQKASANPPWIAYAPPHGVFPWGNILMLGILNMSLDITFVGAAASVVFWTPVLKLLAALGVVDVSKTTLVRALEEGMCVGVVPDGIAGIFHTNEKDEVWCIKHRKGAARLALQTGRPIIPVMYFGNNQVMRVWYDPWGIMKRVSRALKVSLMPCWGRFLLPIPYRTPIVCICCDMVEVGPPNPTPTESDIEAVHASVLASLRRGFETYRGGYGWDHKELRFI